MSLPTMYPVEALESSCTRSVKKVTGSQKFKIMGYSFDKNIDKGKFLESTTFYVGGYDWSICFYPNGIKKTEVGNIAIFLYLKSKSECVKAQVCLTILDQSGSASSISKTTAISKFSTETTDSDNWGYGSFAKKTDLEPYINDDCLVIKATVTVFKVCAVEPTSRIDIPPCNITQQLSHLLENQIGVDVKFEVNGTAFSAHKCILAARSPVFAAQLFGQLKEKSDSTVIKIEEMEAPIFKSLLHFIYCGSIPEFEDMKGSEKEQDTRYFAQHLLVAADRYGLERLKIICQKILHDTIDSSNVVSLLFLADRHNCIQLKKACLEYVVSSDIEKL